MKVTESGVRLDPFWRYFGSKWRAARLYPAPEHDLIVEPFAGSAGYALNYSDRDVLLIDSYHVVVEIWQWLIAACEHEVRSIPLVDDVDELPSWVPTGARHLVGFAMNAATTTPRKKLSAGARRLREQGRQFYGWTHALRERVAWQVQFVKHWKVQLASYEQAPDVEATWFVDPPYQTQGFNYAHCLGPDDYARLSDWCRDRRGQTIVCEAKGASWLPFRDLGEIKSGPKSKTHIEVVWP